MTKKITGTKKARTRWMYVLILLLPVAVFLYAGYAPVREFYRVPGYKAANNFVYKTPGHDPAKKTVLLIADNEGTESFDLIAPFYLFSLTQRANVYIVAQKKYPITIRKGFFILPHYTYREIDSLRIHPAVMVIPRLSHTFEKPKDLTIARWIRQKYQDSTKLLSVCWGSVTAAATGLYDGKPLTSHAIKFGHISKQFPGPQWVKNVSVTQHGNFYSTAGVSNAVEGSLAIIRDLFGAEAMKAVKDSIHYPYDQLKTAHRSVALNAGDNLTIAGKIYFGANKKTGVLLQNDIDEFALVAILDTYHRTFPGSLETFTAHGKAITSRHGLTIIPTGNREELKNLDELHVLNATALLNSELSLPGNTTLVRYDLSDNRYLIDLCMKRIREQYGEKFEHVVRVLLDYN